LVSAHETGGGQAGFLFLKSMLSQEGTKEWWNERYRQADGFYYSKEPSSFLMKWAEIFPKNAQIMDVACGEGRNAVALAKQGFRVTASDFSDVALERAQELGKQSGAELTWKKQDLDFFMPDLMAYDVMLCVDFRPPPTLLKNFFRGLKKEGFVVIESFLTSACQEKKDLEVFETFRSGELLREMGGGTNYQVRYYSEYGPQFEQQKLYYIAQKTEML